MNIIKKKIFLQFGINQPGLRDNMRTIIIGDIHGCYDELISLLDKVNFDINNDMIIFTGDLMDRGTDSYEVLKYVMNIKSKLKNRCVIIRGNHEDMFLTDSPWWWYNGAQATELSFTNNADDVNNYRHWLEKNTSYYYSGDIFNVTHAGIYNDPIEDNEIDTYIWDREPLELNIYTGKLTFIGHTPINNPSLFTGNDKREVVEYEYEKEYNLPEIGLLNIDTGCVFGYRLTCCEINNDKIIFHEYHKPGEYVEC